MVFSFSNVLGALIFLALGVLCLALYQHFIYPPLSARHERAKVTLTQKRALAVATAVAIAFGAYFLRGYFILVVVAAVIFVFDPGLSRRVQQPERQLGLAIEHGDQPAFDARPVHDRARRDLRVGDDRDETAVAPPGPDAALDRPEGRRALDVGQLQGDLDPVEPGPGPILRGRGRRHGDQGGGDER